MVVSYSRNKQRLQITTDSLIVNVVLDRFPYHWVVSLYLSQERAAGLLILLQDILGSRLVPETCYSQVICGYRLRLLTNPGYSTTASSHTLSQWPHAAEDNPVNPLNPELNPICYLLALLAHHFLHVSRIRVKLLTLRRLMSYIYDISCLKVNILTLILLTWRKW